MPARAYATWCCLLLSHFIVPFPVIVMGELCVQTQYSIVRSVVGCSCRKDICQIDDGVRLFRWCTANYFLTWKNHTHSVVVSTW
ncbi:hypothetical protein M758_1G111000 [Ceratodon purpureus]|uniref:Secreted protein n=1 Tax=Ceratodon purpureus TaxID=3225 RepID=A0A8T0J3I7_CERPU|nr:hypothetical protein KC19_1G103800 [Ceratodon purpureus]KAG0629539.1 hypothetical protein M758_1G111000 [Ceratodon purpureus]